MFSLKNKRNNKYSNRYSTLEKAIREVEQSESDLIDRLYWQITVAIITIDSLIMYSSFVNLSADNIIVVIIASVGITMGFTVIATLIGLMLRLVTEGWKNQKLKSIEKIIYIGSIVALIIAFIYLYLPIEDLRVVQSDTLLGIDKSKMNSMDASINEASQASIDFGVIMARSIVIFAIISCVTTYVYNSPVRKAVRRNRKAEKAKRTILYSSNALGTTQEYYKKHLTLEDLRHENAVNQIAQQEAIEKSRTRLKISTEKGFNKDAVSIALCPNSED